MACARTFQFARAQRPCCSWLVSPEWNRALLSGDGECAPVKHVGEPCAGELHARFDGGRLETDLRVLAIYAPTRNRRETLVDPTSTTAPAAYPTNSTLATSGYFHLAIDTR